MSFKKTLVAAGLAAMAGWAPLQSKANEMKQADKAAIRQEQFQAVLRTAMNANMDPSAVKDEAIKYMDFPSFIPVTKDGKFDEKLCQQWVKDFDVKENLPHIKEYLESVKKGASLKEAYMKLAKNVAKEDKEKEQKLLNAYGPLRETMEKMPENSAGGYIVAGLILLLGAAAVLGDDFEESGVGCGCLSAIVGGTIIAACISHTVTDSDRVKYLEKSLPAAYRSVYNAYVDQTITAGKQNIVMMDAKQAAQMIEFSKKEQTQKQPQPIPSPRESR